jgi:hypothetical protein
MGRPVWDSDEREAHVRPVLVGKQLLGGHAVDGTESPPVPQAGLAPAELPGADEALGHARAGHPLVDLLDDPGQRPVAVAPGPPQP